MGQHGGHWLRAALLTAWLAVVVFLLVWMGYASGRRKGSFEERLKCFEMQRR